MSQDLALKKWIWDFFSHRLFYWQRADTSVTICIWE